MLDGDIAVVEANSLTKPGDIVVAVVDDQVTVKYLGVNSAGAWHLEPANAALNAIYPSGSLEVLGVVIGMELDELLLGDAGPLDRSPTTSWALRSAMSSGLHRS